MELRCFLQPMAVILRENVLSLVGNHEYLPTSCAHLLYCIVLHQSFNLTYFFAKRIIHAKDKRNKLIPCGMFLTRLYHYYMNSHQYLRSRAFTLVNRVMEPFSESHMVSFLNLENEPYDTSSSDDDE